MDTDTNINNDSSNPYAKSINDLSNSLINIYMPTLVNTQSRLKELTSKQNATTSEIHKENLALAEVQYSGDIQELFKKMHVYHNKLVNVKKDMKDIYKRTAKLKKRSERLLQLKDKERLIKMQNELEIKREIELIGSGTNKPGSSSVS